MLQFLEEFVLIRSNTTFRIVSMASMPKNIAIIIVFKEGFSVKCLLL